MRRRSISAFDLSSSKARLTLRRMFSKAEATVAISSAASRGGSSRS